MENGEVMAVSALFLLNIICLYRLLARIEKLEDRVRDIRSKP